MVKTYLIDKDYLEKFLNMVSMESVHNILVTPSEKYNVICSHDPEQGSIYMYAYKVMLGDIVPDDKQLLESHDLGFDRTPTKNYIRIYDTKYSFSEDAQDQLIECFKVLMPEVTCSFITNKKFRLTTTVF